MYIDLKRIEFIVTYNCTGKCKHCSVERQDLYDKAYDVINADYAVKCIKEAAEHSSLNSVMCFGGEPLLYEKEVCEIMSVATENIIPIRQIITNGYFSNSEDKIKSVANAIGLSGANDILISVDSFHQESISIQQVYAFSQLLKEYKDIKLRWNPAWVVNKKFENVWNRKTKEILDKVSDLHIATSDGNNISLMGNAKFYLADFYEDIKLDFDTFCGHEKYSSSLDKVDTLSIVPNGDVMVCYFVIGNIYKESIVDIIKRYNPYENILMKQILQGGVRSLLEYAQGVGKDVDIKDCYNACDVCKKIVTSFKK